MPLLLKRRAVGTSSRSLYCVHFLAAMALCLVMWVAWVPVALAASPVQAERFVDAAQDARYQALIAEFRCPKCLNTNLKGSDSPIAVDLRRAVARLLREGRTDQEIRDYLQERYGDFVLYNPPFKPATYVLWLGPLVLLLIAFAVVWRTVIAAKGASPVEPDDEALETVLADLGVDKPAASLASASPTSASPNSASPTSRRAQRAGQDPSS